MGFGDSFAKAISNITTPIGKFFESPGTHIKNGALWALGKVRTVSNTLKKVGDFVKQIPVIGDMATPYIGAVEKFDKGVNFVDNGANALNNRFG